MIVFNGSNCLDICVKNTNKYVRLAIQDLCEDFARVNKAGIKPKLIDTEKAGCLVIEENTLDKNPLQDESFTLQSDGDKIRISANSYLGTIWGIYTFSEKILGVNPCYLFNDLELKQRVKLTVDNIYISEKPQQTGF